MRMKHYKVVEVIKVYGAMNNRVIVIKKAIKKCLFTLMLRDHCSFNKKSETNKSIRLFYTD